MNRIPFLLETKRIVEDRMETSGAFALKQKTQFLLRRRQRTVIQLRAFLAHPPQTSHVTYNLKDPLVALGEMGSPERVAQVHDIQAVALCLKQGHNNPDPQHLCPWDMDICSPEFTEHFLGLKKGVNLTCSAKSYGTAESLERVLENQHRLALSEKAKKAANEAIDPVDGMSNKMRNELSMRRTELVRKALRNLSRLRDKPSAREKPGASLSTVETCRYGNCPNCHEIVIGIDVNTKHWCKAAGEVTITLATFPSSLKRLVYPHDIFREPELVKILGKTATDCGLETMQVDEVFKRFPSLARKRLPGIPEANYLQMRDLIYFITEFKDDGNILTALAVDVVLLTLGSKCPPSVECRGFVEEEAAWGNTALIRWLDSNKQSESSF